MGVIASCIAAAAQALAPPLTLYGWRLKTPLTLRHFVVTTFSLVWRKAGGKQRAPERTSNGSAAQLLSFARFPTGTQRPWWFSINRRFEQEILERHAKRTGKSLHNIEGWVHNAPFNSTEIRRSDTRINRQLFLGQPAFSAQPTNIPREPSPSIHGAKAREIQVLIHDVYDKY